MSNGFFRLGLFIVVFYFLFAGLYHGSVFFIPITFAAILAMLLVPVNNKLESLGLNRALASIISVLLIVLFMAGLLWLLIGQVESLSRDVPQIQQKFNQLTENVQSWIMEKFTIRKEKLQQYVQSGSQKALSMVGTQAQNFISGFMSTTADILLSLIYTFCFLYYRDKLNEFILRVVSEDKKNRTKEVIANTSQVARQYLAGRLLLILFLAIFYSIGFSIIGLKHALFLSIFAAIFSLIPYIGNVIGILFPAVMAIIYSNGMSDLIGVAVVFSIVQFIESYILEPVVVGGQVNLNPFFVILGVVLGGIVWGIPGLILAIPIIGILKILFENIPSLNPYGFLIAETESGGLEEKFGTKLKEWWNKIRGKKK